MTRSIRTLALACIALTAPQLLSAQAEVAVAGGSYFDGGDRGWTALVQATLPVAPLRVGLELSHGETSDEDVFANGEPSRTEAQTGAAIFLASLRYRVGELAFDPGIGAGIARRKSSFNSEELPDESNSVSSTVPALSARLDVGWRVVESLDVFAGARFHWLDFEDAAQLLVIGGRITFD